MAVTSRNGLLHVVSPQSPPLDKNISCLLIQIIPGSLTNSPVAKHVWRPWYMSFHVPLPTKIKISQSPLNGKVLQRSFLISIYITAPQYSWGCSMRALASLLVNNAHVFLLYSIGLHNEMQDAVPLGHTRKITIFLMVECGEWEEEPNILRRSCSAVWRYYSISSQSAAGLLWGVLSYNIHWALDLSSLILLILRTWALFRASLSWSLNPPWEAGCLLLLCCKS